MHTLDPLSIPLIAAAGFSVIACWRCRPAVPIIFGLLLMALCELLIGTGGWWALLPSAIMVLAGLGLPGAGRYQRGRRVAAAVALAASLGVLALGMARPLFLTWPYVFLPLSIWLVYAAFTRAEERSLARAL